MKCKKCGEELVENSAFCTSCGSKIEDQLNEENNLKEVENTQEEITDNENTEAMKEEIEEPKIEKTEIEENKKQEPKTEENVEVKPTNDKSNSNEPKQKKSKTGKIIVVLLILIALIAGGIFLLKDHIEVYITNKEDSDEVKESVEDKMNDLSDLEENTNINEDSEENEVTNNEPVEKTLITTDKRDFYNGLAWSLGENQWICINPEGKVVFRLPSEFNKVTDFTNADYTLVHSGGNKAIIDKTGQIITTDKENQAFDKIISEDVTAGCAVVEKNIDTYEKAEVQYGIINFQGGWILELSADNEFLNSFKTGVIDGVLEGNSELYFVEKAKKVEVTSGRQPFFIGADEKSICYGTYSEDIIRIDRETLEVSTILEDVKIYGKYRNGLLPLKIVKYDKKAKKEIVSNGYYDLLGKQQIKVEGTVVGLTDMSESGYYGIITENNAETKYVTIVDKEGNKQFEPIKGAEECKYLGENRFYISYSNENGKESYVANEKGEKIFNTNSITEYTNGYAIKDKENYVDKDGMIVSIIEENK